MKTAQNYIDSLNLGIHANATEITILKELIDHCGESRVFYGGNDGLGYFLIKAKRHVFHIRSYTDVCLEIGPHEFYLGFKAGISRYMLFVSAVEKCHN